VASVDDVFKALADPTRRELLDQLYREDGQTLGALERRVTMTRFGVMKHLKVLEDAGLIVTKRHGREKHHFLNAVPIRQVHDRWVSKYAEPWAATLTELKTELEEDSMEKVFDIYIKTTPERLWEAITDRELRRRYSFGMGVESDWTEGSAYRGGHPRAPRSHLPRDLGDRAGAGLMPADRHTRPAGRPRQQRTVRRLADGPVRAEDAARDRPEPDHARLAHVRQPGGAGVSCL
jgi:DNA-binding transcriptional ArsR family regulator